jgi:hypothetical protein
MPHGQEQTRLVESSKEGYGSKWAVLPKMMNMGWMEKLLEVTNVKYPRS